MSNTEEFIQANDEMLEELDLPEGSDKKALVASIEDALEELGLLDDDDDGAAPRMVFDVLCAWKPRGLRPENVPPGLRDLVPLAERWGISNSLGRAVRRLTATPEETRAFMSAMDSHLEQINEWLDGRDPAGDSELEQSAFLYMSSANAEL